MLTPLSITEKVRRETLVQRAESADFARIAKHYGFLFPSYVAEESWRKGLKRAIFAARGTHGVLLSFLEEIFSEWIDLTTFTGIANGEDRIALSTTVNCNFTRRLARINGKLYYVESRLTNTLIFARAKTSYFNKADFTPFTQYEIKLLPFLYEEHGCELKIYLDAGILQSPPTYLHPDQTSDRDEHEPYGGILMDLFSNIPSQVNGNRETGAFPIYLDSDEFDTLFFKALSLLLVSGVKERVINKNWCLDAQSLYGSIFNKKVYGTVSPTLPSIQNPSRTC